MPYPDDITSKMLDDHLDPREKCKVCEYSLPTDEVDEDTHTCFQCLEAKKKEEKEAGILLCSECGENFNEDDLKSTPEGEVLCEVCHGELETEEED